MVEDARDVLLAALGAARKGNVAAAVLAFDLEQALRVLVAVMGKS